MRRIVTSIVVGMMAAGALAGCADARFEGFDQPAEVIWEATAQLVGTVSVGEKVALAYLRDGENVSVAAWDLEDGRRLWRNPVWLGQDAAGLPIRPALLTVGGRDYAAYLEGSRIGAELRIVDARSGDLVELASGGAVEWATRPRLCRDAEAFCLRARLPGATHATPLRIDPRASDHAWAHDERDVTPDGARLLGNSVFATDDRDPRGTERLGMVAEDGSVTWTRPYREVFGEDFSSDYGWSWNVEGGPIVVGFGSGLDAETRAAVLTGHATVAPAGLRRVVGLDARTGETRWTIEGGVRCPAVSDDAVHDDMIVLCRIDGGTATVEIDDGVVSDDWSDVELSLVGVRIATGATAWELAVPGATMDRGERVPAALSAERILVVWRDGAARFVDPRTGTERSAGNAVLACVRPRKPLLTPPDETGLRDELRVGEDAFPCTSDGTPAAAFSVGAARAAGVDAGGGVAIMTTTHGLAALRTG